MSFHKLFKLIYRRTDYDNLYDIVWRMIYPDEYEQQQRELKESLNKLNLMNCLMRSLLS